MMVHFNAAESNRGLERVKGSLGKDVIAIFIALDIVSHLQ
jgi:hypothetical protein